MIFSFLRNFIYSFEMLTLSMLGKISTYDILKYFSHFSQQIDTDFLQMVSKEVCFGMKYQATF